MLIIAGSVRIPPANIEKAKPHMETMVRATRLEPGCITYSFAWDVLEPGLVRIFEIYKDAAAFTAHRESAHMKAWRGVGPDIGVSDRDITQYDISSHQKL